MNRIFVIGVAAVFAMGIAAIAVAASGGDDGGDASARAPSPTATREAEPSPTQPPAAATPRSDGSEPGSPNDRDELADREADEPAPSDRQTEPATGGPDYDPDQPVSSDPGRGAHQDEPVTDSPGTPGNSGSGDGVPPNAGSDQPAPVLPTNSKPAPAPIDGLGDVRVMESAPPQYAVTIQAGLPSGCAEPYTHEVDRRGNVVEITVLNSVVQADACTTIYGMYELNVSLGSDFAPGETYTVHVNEELETSFTAQ